MKHLTDAEFVDLLDGTLKPPRREHATTCPACAARAEELALMAAGAEGVDVPEPSPLFWEQFSARVREAVAQEPPPRLSIWTAFAAPRLRVAMAATAAVLLTLVLLRTGMWRADGPGPSPIPVVVTGAHDMEPVADEPLADLEADEAWALVRSLAEDMAAEDMDREGVSARPGAAEHFALRMSDVERIELARLIEEQLEDRARAKRESSS